jgi:hypothetical protein
MKREYRPGEIQSVSQALDVGRCKDTSRWRADRVELAQDDFADGTRFVEGSHVVTHWFNESSHDAAPLHARRQEGRDVPLLLNFPGRLHCARLQFKARRFQLLLGVIGIRWRRLVIR